jgi:hypothetical protein
MRGVTKSIPKANVITSDIIMPRSRGGTLNSSRIHTQFCIIVTPKIVANKLINIPSCVSGVEYFWK